MNRTDLVNQVKANVKANSLEILMATAITGTITTAYLAARSGHKASRILQIEERDEDSDLFSVHRKVRVKRAFKLTWTCYIPPVVSTVGTVASIVAGSRIGSKKTAAVASLLTASDRAFTEYKDKVKEELGWRKEGESRDKVAQDHIRENPPSSTIIVASNQVMCHEAYSGRYFSCDMETLRKAENTVNRSLLRDLYVSLAEFYDDIGLDLTSTSSEIGWHSERQLELRFTSVISPDGKPCLSFSYNYIEPL